MLEFVDYVLDLLRLNVPEEYVISEDLIFPSLLFAQALLAFRLQYSDETVEFREVKLEHWRCIHCGVLWRII